MKSHSYKCLRIYDILGGLKVPGTTYDSVTTIGSTPSTPLHQNSSQLCLVLTADITLLYVNDPERMYAYISRTSSLKIYSEYKIYQ